MREFNTSGPVVPEWHYCIPPLTRINLEEVLELIDRRHYFVLHAPRQTGKTSTLKALAAELNATGKYRCVYANVEGCQTAREDVGRTMRALFDQLGKRALGMLDDAFVDSNAEQLLARHGPDSVLNRMLTFWSQRDERPLILLIDEIDSLEGDSLISVLRQLRAGYDERPDNFPQSVVLCGVRDVRDYPSFSHSRGLNIGGGSAFNDKAESLRLGDFDSAEVRSLLGQHTDETGQEFEMGAVGRIWELTRGQPWLVNALARQACFKDPAGRDRSKPIRIEAVEKAKEQLILDRVTHLDQLAFQLQDERVRRVVMPMLAGSDDWDYSDRDLQYVCDLGLVAAGDEVRMANPIYAEVIPRAMAASQQSGLGRLTELDRRRPRWYVSADGGLNARALLTEFQRYFRENSESWVQRYGHREAGPHLVLHAFLQRVGNSGARIAREYAVGRGRTDLLIEWPRAGETQPTPGSRHVIECKVVRERIGLHSTIRDGLEQTARYMDGCGARSGHLVVFDMRPGRTWEERVFRRDPDHEGSPITVWGM